MADAAEPDPAFFIIDTESVPDGKLLSQVKYPGENLSPEDAIARAQGEARAASHTGSDFLPVTFQYPVAACFRQKNIFSMAKSVGSLHAIDVIPAPENKTSSYLVEQVADGRVDVAAVWDGTKSKFETPPLSQDLQDRANKVYFVELPDVLPNDLLVGSIGLDPAIKESVHQAVLSMHDHDIGIGDFDTWVDISRASDALEALDDLSENASDPLHRVIVRVQADPHFPASDPNLAKYLEAARHALRLSGTEFAEFREHYHKRADISWTIKPIHDGAINLLAEYMDGSGLDPQTFQISFTDVEDLTGRIVSRMRSEMHRIRYVWPYEDQNPTVLRDVDFTYPRGAQLKVLKITWIDPGKNDFNDEQDMFFDAPVVKSDAYQFQLQGDHFKKRPDGPYDFDPMSNTVYRVFLVRPSHEALMFQVLTGLFVVLLAGAAVWAVVDLRGPQAGTRAGRTPPTFDEACRDLVDARLARWHDAKVLDADLLWCDREQIEDNIAELKASGVIVPFDRVRNISDSRGFRASVPFLGKIADATLDMKLVRELHVNPSEVGDASRLSSLIPFLVQKRRIASFLGEPVEWDALNTIAARTLLSMNGNKSPQPAPALLQLDDPSIGDLVSRHFRDVFKEVLEKQSLLGSMWRIKKQPDGGYLLSRTIDLPARLILDPRQDAVQRLTLEFSVPAHTDLKVPEESPEVNAWLLGKVINRSFRRNDAATGFWIEFRPLAVIKTDA